MWGVPYPAREKKEKVAVLHPATKEIHVVECRFEANFEIAILRSQVDARFDRLEQSAKEHSEKIDALVEMARQAKESREKEQERLLQLGFLSFLICAWREWRLAR